MRLTVKRVVQAVALYPDRREPKQEYPELEDDDVRQALEFAASYTPYRHKLSIAHVNSQISSTTH